MYKILIADDEEIIRRGFRQKIAWAEAGFEFLEPSRNGQEAIQTITQAQPDVVITDICMPLVDGLEVAEFVAERHPQTIVIVLSGYDEFEYARSALRSHVVDYLLKPITSRELLELVTKLKGHLDETARRRAEQGLSGAKPGTRAPDATPALTGLSRPPDLALQKAAEVQEYIERNFTQKKLSVDEACRDLFISPSYLSRLLKRHVGKTFVDVLTDCRVARAKHLLATSDLKTCAVADAVGYSDPHYFSTLFKKAAGVTPSEYRSTYLRSERT